jgi:preprotein translocase subunit SecD
LFLLVLVVSGVAAMIGTNATKPKLAIDLAGGTSVTLTATPLATDAGGKGGTITPAQLNEAVGIIRKRVNGFGVSEAQVTTLGSNNIVVSVPGNSSSTVAQQVGQTALLRFRQVIQEGPPMSQAGPGSGAPTQPRVLSRSLLDDAAPSPTPAPAATLAANPSASPSANPSASPSAATSAKPSAGATPSATPAPGKSPQELASAQVPQSVRNDFVTRDCTKPDAAHIGDTAPADAYVVACDREGLAKYVLGPSQVQGTDVGSAGAALPSGASIGNWQIDLNFNSHGTTAFASVTKALAGQPSPLNQLAITLDGLVQSAPTVNEEIASGQAQITGSFTQQQASDLANVLKYGALPLAFAQSLVQTVSATLGSDQLHGGLIAGGIGLLLVVIYCLFFYRGLGVPALAGLTIAAFMSYMAVSLLGNGIGYRLSIAGIAGLIVSIGLTADSFVVFFERLRDEIRDGRTPRAAVEYGWKRAWRTIRTANFVSLLASGVLYYFSIADVKGFAFTLGMATIIDVIVITSFTKPLVTLLMRRPYFAKGKKYSGVGPESLGVRRTPLRPATPKEA